MSKTLWLNAQLVGYWHVIRHGHAALVCVIPLSPLLGYRNETKWCSLASPQQRAVANPKSASRCLSWHLYNMCQLLLTRKITCNALTIRFIFNIHMYCHNDVPLARNCLGVALCIAHRDTEYLNKQVIVDTFFCSCNNY